VGKKACGGKGEYAPLALGRMDAPVQKHRLIARKIIFIVPPCTPGSKKWGDNFHCTPCTPRVPKMGGQCPLHAPRLHRPWLGGRKGIWPVKNSVVGCWHGYLSGTRCRLAYGPADVAATHRLLLGKIQIGFTFLVPAHPVVPDKGPLNVCVCVSVITNRGIL